MGVLADVISGVAKPVVDTFNNERNLAYQREYNAQQQYNYENQFSIAAKDLENAGLSKTLAAGASAGSSSGIMAQNSNSIGASLRDASNDVFNHKAKREELDIARTNAETAKTNAETARTEAETRQKQQEALSEHYARQDESFQNMVGGNISHYERSDMVNALNAISASPDGKGFWANAKNVALVSSIISGKSVNAQLNAIYDWLKENGQTVFGISAHEGGKDSVPHITVATKEGGVVNIPTQLAGQLGDDVISTDDFIGEFLGKNGKPDYSNMYDYGV